jgi:hypothetical protein
MSPLVFLETNLLVAEMFVVGGGGGGNFSGAFYRWLILNYLMTTF